MKEIAQRTKKTDPTYRKKILLQIDVVLKAL